MASHCVGEVQYGVSPVVDACREGRVGTPDVVGGRAFQTREHGPFLPSPPEHQARQGRTPIATILGSSEILTNPTSQLAAEVRDELLRDIARELDGAEETGP